MNSDGLRILSRLTTPLYQFLYPRTCLSCDSALPTMDQRICSACWNGIRKVEPGSRVYADMSNRLMSDGVCSGLVSAFLFEEHGALQSIIHHLKYDGNRSLGLLVGKCLAQRFREDCLPLEIAGIIPVPLHRTKERERGYNQSAVIANAFSAVTGIPARPDILERQRFTVSQTTLARTERLENVRDAFAVRRECQKLVSGNTFILVDDVITTGATIRSCALVLASYGAKPVLACSVALAE